ncbi:MAG: hypothetical protein QW612_05650 [Candidatus Bathyarchaeia archaeon]
MSKEEKLENLLEVLKNINLDFNWLLAVVSLSAQEIAVKKKLDELGESYGEEDFQILANKLIQAMEKKGIEIPHILLSIVRSYRHIRAKIMHDPHKVRLNIDEAGAIFNNTDALVKTLFKREPEIVNIPRFIDSIISSPLAEKVREFSNFDDATKKQVFEAIMNKIALLDWKEVEIYKELFEFLRSALKMEVNATLQGELFEILLYRVVTNPLFGKEKLLSIVAEFTRLSHIKKLIKERKLVNLLIVEYETSGSFIIAGWNAEIMLNLADILNEEEINRVIDAALSNDQITYSWSARSSLKKFLSMHRDKIQKEKAKKLEDTFKA